MSLVRCLIENSVVNVIVVNTKSAVEIIDRSKQSISLRISPKGDKPSPRIVYRKGKQDHQIKNYLEYRNLIKKIMKKLEI